MSYFERIATSAPVSLLREPRFWLQNRSMVATVVGGLVFIAVSHRLTYSTGDPAAWLTVMIHLSVFWGIWFAVRALAKIEVEDAIARLVENRASRELGRIQGKVADRIFLDRLETDFLPHNPSSDKGMLRLFQHILAEARDRRFHPNSIVMQPFREESLGDLLRIQTVQRLALQLGILGTFAGLIIALAELSRSGRDLLEPKSLNLLFGALHLSFGTSVAGLQVAIILAVAMSVVRRRQESFFQDMESASAAMISLARNSINRDDFLVEFEQVRSVMAQLSDRVREQSREAEVQTETIRTGLGQLASLKLDFNGFLDRIREEQGLVLAEMKSVYELISPRRTAEELGETLTQALQRVSDRFQANLKQGVSEIDKVNTGLRLLSEAGEESRLRMERQTEDMERSRAALRGATSVLAESLEKTARIQAELVTATGRQPPPAGAVQGPLGRSSREADEIRAPALDVASRQIEVLCREMTRNNELLSQILALQASYMSLARKPLEWASSAKPFLRKAKKRLAARWPIRREKQVKVP